MPPRPARPARATVARRRWVLAACCLLPIAAPAAPVATPADAYRDARAALVAAYEAEDYPAMRAAAERALVARPDYPGALFNLALARALDGDPAAALASLQRLGELRIDPGVTAMAEFEGLHTLPGWAAYATAMAALAGPVGQAEVAFTHTAGDFVPEGIAVAADGRTAWLGSIRHGVIQRVGDDAGLAAAPGPHWSVYGMRLEGERLWFVSAAVEQFAALEPADAGRTGLFSLRPGGEGGVRPEVLLPDADGAQVLGDLEFGLDGGVYLSDQAGGAVYRYVTASGRLDVLVPPGRLVSPQGLALAADGAHLYVADWLGGLFRVRLADGDLQRVAAPADTSLYGIDGLYRYRDSLVAIQNGIRPHRVVQLRLAADGAAVRASRILAMNLPAFDEPNLGQVLGDDFYFIANSHWNRFDADGRLPEGLAGPVVLKLGLDTAD